MKSQLIQNRAGTSVIQVRELCPLGFDQPLSQKKKKKNALDILKTRGTQWCCQRPNCCQEAPQNNSPDTPIIKSD